MAKARKKKQPDLSAYRNPLRDASVTPERIDQGVDYAGSGPVYSLGPGRVLMTKNGGWPGGAFIAVLLTDGPAKGHITYVAEDVQPTVVVGQHVGTNTVIGYLTPGDDGIETGWAAPEPDLGEALAGLMGQFSGANSTAYGAAYNRLLTALGAPSGILQNRPPTGTAPAWASGGLGGVQGQQGGRAQSTGATQLAGAGQGCIATLLLWPVLIPYALARRLLS